MMRIFVAVVITMLAMYLIMVFEMAMGWW